MVGSSMIVCVVSTAERWDISFLTFFSVPVFVFICVGVCVCCVFDYVLYDCVCE